MSSTRPLRWLRSLLVAVVLLGCLGFIADRVAESLAEDRLAAAAEDEAAKYDVHAAESSAEIGGFGFLPQLVRGEFSTVTLTMQRPTVSAVAAQDLTATMTGIRVPREVVTGDTTAGVTAETAQLRLRLSPDALSKLAARTGGLDGLRLRIVKGKLQVRVAVQGFEASATVQPKAENGRIRAVVDDLPPGTPDELRDTATALVGKGIPVPKLPFGASLRGVSVEGGSVVLTAVAADVELSA
jgi:hypothetical protein